MIYDTVVFALCKMCNASCKHCCFSCTPNSKEKLNFQRINTYIDESAAEADITKIAFTGGECFLYYRDLLEFTERAAKANKIISVATNGFWGTDYKTAYQKLYELKKRGLKNLNISHDAYHSEYINTANIKNILKASSDLDITTHVVIVKTKCESVGAIIDKLGSDIYTAGSIPHFV